MGCACHDFDTNPVFAQLVLKRARISVASQSHDDMEIGLALNVDAGDPVTEALL